MVRSQFVADVHVDRASEFGSALVLRAAIASAMLGAQRCVAMHSQST